MNQKIKNNFEKIPKTLILTTKYQVYKHLKQNLFIKTKSIPHFDVTLQQEFAIAMALILHRPQNHTHG